MKQEIPIYIIQWLENRNITTDVIKKFDIGFNGKDIIIPVRDIEGKLIFNKYRRNPQSMEGPKYKYETGAKSTLYGLDKSINEKTIVICEGELDCLVLLSNNIPAVSSTGGSGTFKEEWVNYFVGKDVYICYDNDEAGINGAFKVQELIPWAKVIWLPESVGPKGDVTDYFTRLKKNKEDFLGLMKVAESYKIPVISWRNITNKKELVSLSKSYVFTMDSIKGLIREARSEYKNPKQLEFLLSIWADQYQQIKRKVKFFDMNKDIDIKNRLLKAKTVPIPLFINFNTMNSALCIWHKEQTPSMYYYKNNNKVHCFGCGVSGDTVDVVQKLNKVSLKEAIDIILKQ